MPDFNKHLIKSGATIMDALVQLNLLAIDAVLFVVDDNRKLIGSLTDGDVRRALIKGILVDESVDNIVMEHPKYLKKDNYDIKDVIEFRDKNFKIIPVLNNNLEIINVINFRLLKSYLPLDVVLMAGGRGERLKPLTDNTPKPMLMVGEKPILKHNLDRLSSFGIQNFWLSINYLGEQIEDYFLDGKEMGVSVRYIKEEKPLGTIGSLSLVDTFIHDYILLTNSDILTNLDYEEFFVSFLNSGADIGVATIPYQVDIPYAVLEMEKERVVNLKEKPTYTYFSNAGIYIIKKEVLASLPKNEFFNATDLMEKLMKAGGTVVSFPISGYWLDIGRHEDFVKAQKDVTQIKF